MKHTSFCLSLIFALNAYFSNAQQSENIAIISGFVHHIKSNDSKTLAEKIKYPLKRKYPLPSINNSSEFLDKYKEIFDDSLKFRICNSDFYTDWKFVGNKRIMLNNGELWLDKNGNLIGLNYESEKEEKKRRKLIKQDRKNIHESLKEYWEPVLLWETESYRIRIDKVDKYSCRLAIWEIDKTQKEAPYLLINNGLKEYEGSEGKHNYVFVSGDNKYICSVLNIGRRSIKEISFIENGKEILTESVITELNQ